MYKKSKEQQIDKENYMWLSKISVMKLVRTNIISGMEKVTKYDFSKTFLNTL